MKVLYQHLLMFKRHGDKRQVIIKIYVYMLDTLLSK